MDYYLENLRTGDQHALNPNRTLIGSAGHAAIQTEESGPFLAALIVAYSSGWVVHGLADADVCFNGKPLRVSQHVMPQSGDRLEIAQDRFRFAAIPDSQLDDPVGRVPRLPSCFAYICFPDGMEECRVVDHNLLLGRLRVCHVRYPDTKLSRLNALIAAHEGVWYAHSLGKGIIARNRHAVSDYAILADGDELLIGPLVVRIELREPAVDEVPDETKSVETIEPDTLAGIADSVLSGTGASVTDFPTIETTFTTAPVHAPTASAIHGAGLRLDHWLRSQGADGDGGSQPGLGGWFGAQKERLKSFWLDTPETTSARVLRTSGKPEEAFAILDRAIRARPESADLLRELYRLYDSVGLYDLCFRPLRQIEKLAAARGGTDTWVLETLARVCERLGKQRPSMFDRAVNYWTKLERATGINYAREKAATMASRTLSASSFSKNSSDEE